MLSLQWNFQESLHASIYRDVLQPSLTGCLPNHQNQHYNHKKSNNKVPHANALCHFHIAASINPATGQSSAELLLPPPGINSDYKSAVDVFIKQQALIYLHFTLACTTLHASVIFSFL